MNVRRVTTIARLNNGVTREQASAELQSVGEGIEAEHPELYRRAGERLVSGWTLKHCMRR